MNEYIVSNSTGWIGINNGTNLVLMSVTDNLESGGRMSNTQKDYLIGLGGAPKYELIRSNGIDGEAIVTIGGNFLSDELEEKGNLVYHAENVQGAVAAINFLGDGKVYITAQSGAIGPDAKDSDVMVVVTNQFLSPDSASGSGEQVDEESRITASQNVSAAAFKAFKTLTIGGSFSGHYGDGSAVPSRQRGLRRIRPDERQFRHFAPHARGKKGFKKAGIRPTGVAGYERYSKKLCPLT